MYMLWICEILSLNGSLCLHNGYGNLRQANQNGGWPKPFAGIWTNDYYIWTSRITLFTTSTCLMQCRSPTLFFRALNKNARDFSLALIWVRTSSVIAKKEWSCWSVCFRSNVYMYSFFIIWMRSSASRSSLEEVSENHFQWCSNRVWPFACIA